MANSQASNLEKKPRWLYFLIIFILVLGIYLRFTNIDRKIYWVDENFTSIRVAGYTIKEIKRELTSGKILSVEDIQKYQRINSQKGLSDTIKGLAKEESQLTPLYFIFTRFWVNCFGNSVTVTRSISVLFSLLVFPSVYWVCLELFGSSLVGWIAMALIAISPFHILYAQEARPYSLWTATILLSSGAFLRAIRVPRKMSWLLYVITMIIGLYTYLLTGLILIAHGLYLYIVAGCKITRNFIIYLLASLLIFLAFSPWIVTIIINFDNLANTTSLGLGIVMPVSELISEWLANISYSLMDFWYYFIYFPSSRFNLFNLFNFNFCQYLIPTLIILIGYSFYFLCRKTSIKIWLFILLLVNVNFLPMAIQDFLLGGYRSTIARYFVPCYLGIHLSLAYLFARKIQPLNIHIHYLTNQLWKLCFVTILIGGIISGAISSQAESWWNKIYQYSWDHVLISKIVNQTSHPLLILRLRISDLLPICHQVNTDVKFQLLTNGQNIDRVPDQFNHIFLFESSRFPVEKFAQKQQFHINLVYTGTKRNLWKLARSNLK